MIEFVGRAMFGFGIEERTFLFFSAVSPKRLPIPPNPVPDPDVVLTNRRLFSPGFGLWPWLSPLELSPFDCVFWKPKPGPLFAVLRPNVF